MFGFSATTRKRGDGADLRTEALFGPVLYEMDYAKAEALGYVAPIRYYMVDVHPSECNIASTNWTLPAFKKMYCYWFNHIRNQRLMRAAATIPAQLNMGPDPQTMVAVETLGHAYALKRLAPEFQVVYADRDRKDWEKEKANGKIPEDEEFLDRKTRERLRENFSAGRLRKVICTPTWSTGMNFTNLDVVVNAAGATSEILNTQWGGRASRTREDKAFALLIDSADQWDEWTRKRSLARRRLFHRKGWKPVQGVSGAYSQESML